MKNLRLLIALVLIVSTILLNQNCGEVTLVIPPKLVAPTAVVRPFGNICPGKAPAANQEIRFLFIVDMSLSNLGGVNRIGDNLVLDRDNAVDWDGDRFEAVKTFIDNCGLATGSQYSVIGFSTQEIFGQSSGYLRGCESSFVSDKAVAKQFVDDLKQVQLDDIARDGSTSAAPPFVMGQTSYRNAITCAQTNINVDLAINYNPNAFYQIFFITDGEPNEIVTNLTGICGTDTNCQAMFNGCNPSDPEFSECVNQILAETYYPNQVTALAQKIRMSNVSFTFQPVYYGFDDEYLEAKASLDLLARIDNPEGETIRASDLSTLSVELCESLNNETEVPFMVNNMFMINLTAKEKSGVWYADSDMDGLIDIEEVEKDLDPLNPRTRGILDSVCDDRFGENCLTQAPVCTSALGFLLKNCDSAVLPQNNLTGIDTDEDGILDIVEMIVGTVPNLSDSANGDFDGDGKSNIKEISLGTNPRVPTPFATIPNTTDIAMSAVENTASCGGDLNGYRFEARNFPFVNEVKEFDSTDTTVWNLDHANGENVYLLYYIANPTSSLTGLRKKIYGTVIKIKDNGQPIEIRQNNFSLIGEI